jgi:glycogen operon protein
LTEKHADIHRFAKTLIGMRMSRHLPVERLDLTLNELLRRQPFTWHGVRLNAPDWSHESHTLAATVTLPGTSVMLHFIVNAFWEALEFELPALMEAGAAWRRCLDTSLDAPADVCGWKDAPSVQERTYRVQARSVVVLVARTAGDI